MPPSGSISMPKSVPRAYEALAHGCRQQLQASVDPEPFVKTAQPRFDRRFRHAESLRDLLIDKTVIQKIEELLLVSAQSA